MEDTIRYEYDNGTQYIFPNYPTVKNWRFNQGQEAEAKLCYAMAELAEKNGVDINTLHHMFPATLRMLKTKGGWAE